MEEKPFDMIDPYNPQNKVQGKVVTGGLMYGDLFIEAVNDVTCRQHIHCTPKFTYPGGCHSLHSVGEKQLEIEFDDLRVYDKIDGTNILLYKYRDREGNVFVSYKTRLVPFLSDTGWSTWITMWNSMLEKYDFSQFKYDDGYNYAFEMFGSVNQIVIDYSPVFLDCAFLYSVNIWGSLSDRPEIRDFPRPKLLKWHYSYTFAELYRDLEEEMEIRFVDEHDVEGVVMYAEKDGSVTPHKCKAPSIIRAQGGKNTISRDEIWTTAINGFESGDDPLELLKEVYHEKIVELYKPRILEIVKEAEVYIRFRKNVIDQYKLKELDINRDKGTCMRAMMQDFLKNQSARVYTILWGIFGKK